MDSDVLLKLVEMIYSAAGELFDALREGVILLDEDGTVILVNHTASVLLEREKTLRLSSAGLSTIRAAEQKKLCALIQGALKPGNGAGVHSGSAMTVARDGLQRPLQLLVAPLHTQTIRLGRAVPVAAIFITDPDAKPQLPAHWLTQLYGLTPAEARLAVLLASGDTLKDASKQLGVSLSTVQSHLKSIFGKTGTSRQSELVRLLVSAPVRGPVP